MNLPARFVITGLVGSALVGLAFAAAAIFAGHPPSPAPSDFQSYALYFTKALTILLLIPTFSVFILQRDMQPSDGWKSLWTSSLIAFVAHVVSSAMAGDVVMTSAGVALAAWWGSDVLFAWTTPSTPRCIHNLRAALNFTVFTVFAVTGTLSRRGLLEILTAALVLTVLASMVTRIAVRRDDPNSFVDRAYVAAFQALNVFVPWYRLPTSLAVLNLGALRLVLRAKNLYGTSGIPTTRKQGLAPVPPLEARDLLERTQSGCYNDLDKPTMGRASMTDVPGGNPMSFTLSDPGSRFGRNVPFAFAGRDSANLLNPNPREISQKLLARREFIPATTLNLLAAAWIQFQTHDWFNHGEPEVDNPMEVPLPRGDTWYQCPMRVRRTRRDPTRDYAAEQRESGRPEIHTYVNAGTHWWDASQVYGDDAQTLESLRTDAVTHKRLDDGKLYLPEQHLPFSSASGIAVTGFTDNWWVGLSLMHLLFAREHNAICDRLRGAYPEWDGDHVFAVARMINTAVIAKIHTVEWTPAILHNPTVKVILNANWWGLQTERVKKLLGRLSENELFGGIPGSGVDHGVADYSFTEEFVAVYRMHPLMPDVLDVRSAITGTPIKIYDFPDAVVGPEKLIEMLERDGASMEDLFYSFGTSHPGAITLHNYPAFLRNFKRRDETLDLASVEILRDRERGVPRYNQFRRLFHLPPIRSFDDLRSAQHPTLPEELREVYGTKDGVDNVELLDLMVGLFSEAPPPGFGFSDTAFRVFILMASRRLKSDRFFAGEFDADVYTQVGLDWINDTTMKTVLLRHFPALGPALRGVDNPFAPWSRVGG